MKVPLDIIIQNTSKIKNPIASVYGISNERLASSSLTFPPFYKFSINYGMKIICKLAPVDFTEPWMAVSGLTSKNWNKQHGKTTLFNGKDNPFNALTSVKRDQL